MHNKSKDKITAKPPIPLKSASTINRPPSKITENVLPAIKPRKESFNTNKKTSSLSKPITDDKTITLSNRGSSKKIEAPTVIANKKPVFKDKPKNYLEKPGWDRLPLNLFLEIA